jgi:hypothetical protein
MESGPGAISSRLSTGQRPASQGIKGSRGTQHWDAIQDESRLHPSSRLGQFIRSRSKSFPAPDPAKGEARVRVQAEEPLHSLDVITASTFGSASIVVARHEIAVCMYSKNLHPSRDTPAGANSRWRLEGENFKRAK